ncbi:conserved protein of unknown function [Petrocella atlantisensis]|uniref:Uncharacterized protein n=1 Tax=Petrocella atlantisensis TaxID=2173034 RepID=A0A3P7PW58_9FIRM|nr:conserved protein of unknown function [Petrocella atlantisensis]
MKTMEVRRSYCGADRKMFHNELAKGNNRNRRGVSMRKYGLFSFLFDCILAMITGGLWLIWIFVREMRRRK